MHARNSILLAMAACLAAATFAVAQPKPQPSQPPKAAVQNDPHPMPMCPMHEVLELADVAVDDTAQGASIRLTAKRAEDVGRVRELAHKLADMGKGECMQDGHPAHHGMGHDHAHH